MPEFRIDVVIDPRTQPGARRVESSLKRIDDRANAVRSNLTRMLTLLGGGALITSSIRTLAQFEQTMSTVQAVTGATAGEFESLTQKAKDLGITTRFTATQAAEGLVELARAGLTTGESLEAVGDTLVLAQAGALGLAEAAGITTTALKVFNLEADQTSRIADDLVIVANSTKTNVTEMGQAFTFAAANAADLNLSVEETTALLGALANGGLVATRGGTALRAVLLGLAAPTTEAGEALAAAGLSLEDIDIRARGIIPVLQTLADAQLDVEAKTAIFGKRFGAAASILLKNIPLVEELVQKQSDLAGEAQRVADVMDDNLNGALLKLKSAFEGLVLEVGSGGATGALRGLFESIANGLRFLAANVDVVIDALETIVILLGVKFARFAVGAALTALQALSAAFLASPAFFFAKAIGLGVVALATFGDEIAVTEDGVVKLGDVFSVTLDTITMGLKEIGDGLGAVVAPLIADIPNALGEATGGFEGFILGVATALDSIVGLFKALRNVIIELFDFERLGKAILSGLIGAVNAFIQAIEKALDAFRATFQGLFDFVAKGFSNLVEIAEQYLIIAKNVTTGSFEANEAALETIERLQREQEPAQLGASINAAFRRFQGEQTFGLLEDPFKEEGEDLGRAVGEGFAAGFEEQVSTGFVARAQEIIELARQRAEIRAQLDEDESTRQAFEAAQAEQQRAVAARETADALTQQVAAGKQATDVLGQYLTQLRQEQNLLGLTSREREIANEILQLENELREKGVELTAAQREQVQVELERLQLLQVQADIIDQIRGPAEEQRLQQEALNNLFREGKISIEEYNAALRNLAAQSAQTAGVLGSTVQPGLETIGQQLFGIGQFTQQTLGAVFGNLEQALVSFAKTGEFSFSKLVDSMLQDIARLLVQQGLQLLLSLLGGGIGGAAGGLLGGLFGGGGGGQPQFVGGGSYGGGGGIAAAPVIPVAPTVPSIPIGGGGGCGPLG